jgi:hypothetical protein
MNGPSSIAILFTMEAIMGTLHVIRYAMFDCMSEQLHQERLQLFKVV